MDERTKRLRKAVEDSGYSQTQLCEITGINKGALSSYLSGRYYPKQQAIEKLSEALKVPIFWLMGYENEEDSQEENSYYIDKEARKLAQFLFENPEYRVLFDAAKDVSAKDLETVKTIIDKFKK
jgi:transcriptional regulator|nr:MAG TPA: helix-turn-helix domain protein [Caudoviricetes sp.]